MGRGLSPLQRHILTEASTRKRLYYADVLKGFFGFSEKRNLGCPGSQKFDPHEIGVSRYKAATASLSRACTRLGKRGLVTCLQGLRSRWSAVEITEAGRLLVITAENLPPI